MSTNIVPGCQCLCLKPEILRSDNATCVAETFIPCGTTINISGVKVCIQEDVWVINKEVVVGLNTATLEALYDYHIAAKYLMRIDGHETDEIEHSKELVLD